MVVHIKAASLNYRDLLTRGDVAGIRQGLVPLSDAAGTVVAVGRDVTRWQLGDRVSPAFFPTWLAGQFSTAHLAHALGGGGTDGVLAALRQAGGRHGQHGLRPTRTQGRHIAVRRPHRLARLVRSGQLTSAGHFGKLVVDMASAA